MDLTPRLRLVTLLVMGSVGAVAGHALGYWAAHPLAHERDAVLEASGHGYLDMAIAVALVAGLMALLGEFAIGLLGRRDSLAVGEKRWRVAAALALVQTSAFIVVEVAERILSGLDAFAVMAEPAFWVGVPLQVVIAAGVTLLLTLARNAGIALRIRLRGPLGDKRITLTVWSIKTEPVAVWIGFAFSRRGPPLLARALTL